MLVPARSYHAHVYFDDAQRELALALRDRAERDLAGLATVWSARMRPVGPHHWPMFEIEFPHASREPVLAWVREHHGPLSVMLHPETEDELGDHRDRAVWLGENLGLNLAWLEEYLARRQTP